MVDDGVYIITGIFIILMFLLGLAYLDFHYKETELKYNSQLEIKLENFTETIDKINNKYGSSFIVQRYNTPGYFVFNGGNYIPLEDCLN